MALLVQLLTLVNPVRVLILAILTYLLCPWLLKLINEFRFSKKFSKLPRLPIIGPAGWLLGNLDIYYYTMRHLSVAQGASKWLLFSLVCDYRKITIRSCNSADQCSACD